MDKFLTFQGQQPIWLNDFNFITKSMSDTLTRIIQSLVQEPIQNCILQGCNVTISGGMLQWTDGIVMLDGEILPVRAGQIPDQPAEDYYHFKIVNEYDPLGKRVFKDGTTHDCYQLRYVTIEFHGNPDYTVTEMTTLELELETLYNREKKIHLYSMGSGSPTEGTSVDLIQNAGGMYLSGKFKVFAALGVTTNVVMPETQFKAFNGYLPDGKRTSVMCFSNLVGASGMLCPIIVSIRNISAGLISISISFDKELSFSMGEGNFYVRLN